MSTYSAAFRANAIKKMMGPNAQRASAVAKELGVSGATLSRWKQDASIVLGMADQRSKACEPAPTRKRSQDWTAEEKLGVVVASQGLGESELGSLLRREGLHLSQLEEWRRQSKIGLMADAPGGKRSAEQRLIRQLERELRRKDQALAETTALLVLKKKFAHLFEDEESDTGPRTGD